MLQQRFSIVPSPEDFGPPRNTPRLGALRQGALELLWPTRCAVCDAPGTLLCESCRKELRPYDPWLACPTCGAPFGFRQCCECNSFSASKTFNQQHRLRVFSAFVFNGSSGLLVKRFKDSDEMRLAPLMARSMLHALSPETARQLAGIVYIPCSKEAFLRRGYDHIQLIGKELSALLNTPLLNAYQRPQSLDQRVLSRAERYVNMQGAFALNSTVPLPSGPLLLIDDVLTTGATLNAAAQVLFAAGVSNVIGLTFARVV